jgi:hypothetical protein
MGGAYLTEATDEFSLFYNPAILGRNKGLEFYPLNAKFGSMFSFDGIDKFSDLPEEPTEIVNEFLNYPIYLQAGTNPGFKFGGFGLSVFYDLSVNALIYNQVHPFLDLDYRYDRGFITGYGHSLKVGKGQLSIGGAAKYIKRKGLQKSFNVFGTEFLNALASTEDIQDLSKNLGLKEDNTWSFDLGLDYEYSAFKFGVVAQDILGAKFEGDIADDEMSVSFGGSFNLDLKLIDIIFSASFNNVSDFGSIANAYSAGAMLDLPGIDVFGGMNVSGLSYGIELDLFIFELTAGIYSVNTGVGSFVNKSKRAVVYLSLLNFSLEGI